MTEMLYQIIAWATGFVGLGLFQWLNTRKANKRLAEAQADLTAAQADMAAAQTDTEEWGRYEKQLDQMEKHVEYLQTQLDKKEERFAEQTQLVRRQNRDLMASERRVAELEIELAMTRCDDTECPWRKPPNASTPPKPGLSKEEYHTRKSKKQNQSDKR